MNFDQVIKAVTARVLHQAQNFATTQVKQLVATNMMSKVLAGDHEQFLLITSLSSDQSLRTADVVSAEGVLIADGKEVLQSMIDLAEEFDLNLLATDLPLAQAQKALQAILV